MGSFRKINSPPGGPPRCVHDSTKTSRIWIRITRLSQRGRNLTSSMSGSRPRRSSNEFRRWFGAGGPSNA